MSREYPCIYYDEQKCKKLSEDGYTSWCVLGPCSHETPSNADRIRAMSDEELAALLSQGTFRPYDLLPSDALYKIRLFWLKQPVVQPEEQRKES